MLKFQQSGLILLSTITIIIIISLLLLTETQQILLYAKALGHQKEYYQNLDNIEAVAKKLLHKKGIFDNWECIVEQDEANRIIKLVVTKGCAVVAMKEGYQYLIEDLGIFDCLQINKDSRILASHHYRLSLVHKGEKKSFLQMRLVRSSAVVANCAKKAKIIPEGISVWRFGNLV